MHQVKLLITGGEKSQNTEFVDAFTTKPLRSFMGFTQQFR